MNVDSPAAGQYAESAGLPWVGYDSDAQKFAPKQWLTAAVYNWGVYYIPRVKASMDGTWKTGSYYGSLSDGFTKLAPFGSLVSSATKAAIATKLALLWPMLKPMSGSWPNALKNLRAKFPSLKRAKDPDRKVRMRTISR